VNVDKEKERRAAQGEENRLTTQNSISPSAESKSRKRRSWCITVSRIRLGLLDSQPAGMTKLILDMTDDRSTRFSKNEAAFKSATETGGNRVNL